MAEMPWPYDHCILCLEKRELSLEHVIPQQIGGRLTARFLCKPCNDELGYRIEAEVRSDPSIRLAAENLRDQIPDLAEAIRDRQAYIASGPGGTIPGSFKRGRFQIRAATQDDGSVVQPTPDARMHLRRILAKRGVDEEEIERRLAQFDEAPDNTLVDLGVNVQAVRWDIDEIYHVLEGPFLSPAVLAKIAYEFLACHAGDLVLKESPQLAALRGAVRGGSAEAIEIERLQTSKYQPLHGLAMGHDDDHAVLTICLFGWLVFRVHLRQIALAPPHFIYTCKLDTGEEYCAELPH
jgi:hypothetical protein